ncbi:hypothetical protein ACFQU7_15105 [Pseudoroseomonas wenyumeiae]
MRASATGAVDFDGLPAPPAVRIGQPGDYHRQPLFSGGAWRFLAVQTGVARKSSPCSASICGNWAGMPTRISAPGWARPPPRWRAPGSGWNAPPAIWPRIHCGPRRWWPMST